MLAYHVDYWDRLGLKDHYASAAYTQRQSAQQSVNGARFACTPQVVVDGFGRKDWPSAPMPTHRQPASIDLFLVGSQDGFSVTVRTGADAPKRVAGYWAVTEQGDVSVVKAVVIFAVNRQAMWEGVTLAVQVESIDAPSNDGRSKVDIGVISV